MGTESVNPNIRVLIVGDNSLLLEVVAASLSFREEIVLVGWMSDPDGAAEKIQSQAVDVVLIDAGMEKSSAAWTICKIKEEYPDIKVIAFGLGDREEDNLKFIEAGASGYVLKSASIDEMLSTIRLVYNGETDCSPRMSALVFVRIAELSRERSREPLRQIGLTRREKEILLLIAKGSSNKDISRQLCITPYTVKNHVHNLLEKLQVHRRRDAIRYAYGNGILKMSEL